MRPIPYLSAVAGILLLALILAFGGGYRLGQDQERAEWQALAREWQAQLKDMDAQIKKYCHPN